ncbi:MAG: PDZ domain-containing protein [Proteobacteria bacterium]|nr:PDZ domain-containing protein [Pseudomonadota bacterium]
MKMWKVIIPAAAVLLLAGQAAAQAEDEARARFEEAREAAEIERMQAMEAREAAMEEKLREAEERMAAAAREIAEITKERLPRIVEVERRYAMSNRPRLGVTIKTSDEDVPVEGVSIVGVTPGSAAAEAGLRSGDVLTSVNDEALSAGSRKEANSRLLDFMKGVEEGDVLTVEYLRDGKVGSVEAEPRILAGNTFTWMSEQGPRSVKVPAAPVAPRVLQDLTVQFGFPWVHSGLGELELVELNEGLGRYFGTDEGLLVVSAPHADAIDIRDGDVIQSIDGREPRDARHAMKILGSYQGGEKLKLGIMRDRKKMTIDVEIPVDFHGALVPDVAVPAAAPGVQAPAGVPHAH